MGTTIVETDDGVLLRKSMDVDESIVLPDSLNSFSSLYNRQAAHVAVCFKSLDSVVEEFFILS